MTTPPLLMLAEGRKPRPRKVPTNRPKEIALHMAIAKVLREHCLPDWQWTAYSQRRTARQANGRQAQTHGRQGGWPDIMLVPPLGQLHYLEQKRIGEDLSAAQEDFQIWCIRHSVPHSVVFTFDQALAVLDHWGCLRIKIGGEPCQ